MIKKNCIMLFQLFVCMRLIKLLRIYLIILSPKGAFQGQ